MNCARPEALRPGVIQQDVSGDVPAQVAAGAVADGRAVRRARCDVGAVGGLAGSEVGRRPRRTEGPPPCSRSCRRRRPDLLVVVLEMANAARDRQHLRDHVEIERRELRQLLVAALDVVEEPDGRIRRERWRARPRLDGQVAVVVEPGRRTVRNRHVAPLGLVDDIVFFPVHAHRAADALVVRRAQAQLLALVSVSLVFRPGRARRVALAGGGIRRRVARALVVVGVSHRARSWCSPAAGRRCAPGRSRCRPASSRRFFR